MDSFEWNKIAGGVIASVLVVMAINTFGGALFPETELEQNAYVVEGVEEEATAVADAGAAPAAEGPSLAVLLNAAKPEDGEKLFRRCAACHSIDAGAGHRTGPNLYNTVGHKVGGHDGFNYSAALQGFGDVWTFEHLDEYLADPKGYIPGNKMAFAGLRKAEDRAAVIVYLNSKMDTPLPLPEPAAEADEETVPASAADSEGDQKLEVEEQQ